MTKIYSNICIHRNKIIEIGYENGVRFQQKHKFKPTIGIETEEKTNWKTLKDNKYLQCKQFPDIRSYNEYVKEYSDSIPLHGVISPKYQFINEQYQEKLTDISLVRVLEFDIEAVSKEGFPDPGNAKWPINSITIKDKNKQLFYVLSTKDYDKDNDKIIIENGISPDQIKFQKCKTEKHLLLSFITIIQKIKPDVLIGYFSNGFDFPYLINRMFNRLTDEQVMSMSPLNYVSCVPKDFNGRTTYKSVIKGIALLDYLDLYKKYILTPSESYKLDFIAEEELGKNKIKYDEVDDLTELWEKDSQKFIAYNIIDVELIDLLDKKLNLIDLLLTISYDSKCNFEDCLGTIIMWDVIFYNELKKEGIMCPPMHHNHRVNFAGGYVKEPTTKLHNWLFTLDLNSLYPHLQMQFNISPECLIGGYVREDVDLLGIDKRLLNTEIKVDQNYILAGNGYYFRKDKKGFVPKVLENIYNKRVLIKKEMLKLKQEYENTKNDELLTKISSLHNQQMAAKIKINSEYGFLGAPASRYYDPRLASAVTLSGQWAIKWIAKYLMEHDLQKKYKWEHEYSDTDSIAISIGYVAEQLEKKFENITKQEMADKIDKFIENIIQPIIDDGYEKLKKYCNANEQKMIMKREKIITSAFWVAKKKYACMVIDNEGVRYKEPKLSVSGIEIVRSSTPQVCKESLKQAVILILTDSKKLKKFINGFEDTFKTYSPEQIAFPRGCNNIQKNIDENKIYSKGCPIHVRATILYNKYIIENEELSNKFRLIDEGDKMKFIYMITPNPIWNENVFGFIKKWPDSKLIKYVDYKTQYYKSFYSIIEKICDKIGLNISDDINLNNIF